jgi:hypothetical protein
MNFLGVIPATKKENKPFSLEGSQVHFSDINPDLSYLSTEIEVVLIVDSHITSRVSLVLDLHIEVWREILVLLRHFSGRSELVVKGITDLSLLPFRDDLVVHLTSSASA